MKFALAALALLTLAACTEQDLCINRVTSDLRATERQIDTLRGNISRGYAIHVRQERVTVAGVCYRKNGKPYTCPKTEWQRVETPVPINVRDQRRQLQSLETRLPTLKAAAASSIGQCRDTYPE